MRIIVTGGNSGVGRATAEAMAAAGHDVVIACRTLSKAHEAAAAMPGNVEVAELDLADLGSVRKFAESVDHVDVLVNNAGVLGLPLTRDGSALLRWAGTVLSPRIAQHPADGARSTIQAVTTDLPNGTYIAPRGLFHQCGGPKPTKLIAKARDPETAHRLWNLSTELTGCSWQEN